MRHRLDAQIFIPVARLSRVCVCVENTFSEIYLSFFLLIQILCTRPSHTAYPMPIASAAIFYLRFDKIVKLNLLLRVVQPVAQRLSIIVWEIEAMRKL